MKLECDKNASLSTFSLDDYEDHPGYDEYVCTHK